MINDQLGRLEIEALAAPLSGASLRLDSHAGERGEHLLDGQIATTRVRHDSGFEPGIGVPLVQQLHGLAAKLCLQAQPVPSVLQATKPSETNQSGLLLGQAQCDRLQGGSDIHDGQFWPMALEGERLALYPALEVGKLGEGEPPSFPTS